MAGLASLVGATLAPAFCRLLFLIGFSSVIYTGMSYIVDLAVERFNSYLLGIPTDMLAMASLLQIPQAASIVFGAIATRIALTTTATGAKAQNSILPVDCNF